KADSSRKTQVFLKSISVVSYLHTQSKRSWILASHFLSTGWHQAFFSQDATNFHEFIERTLGEQKSLKLLNQLVP
ncbi:hypothetical protein BGW37DRAFT_431719, partial [Umbelopsis sp. PMI_123]